MLGVIDLNLKPYEERLFLCKPNRQTIAELNEAFNRNFTYNWAGGIHELKFSVPYVIEKNKEYIRNPHIDFIRGHYLIRYEKYDSNGTMLDQEYFVIVKPKNTTSNGREVKDVQAYLLPYETKDKLVRGYQGTKILQDVITETLCSKTDWKLGSIDYNISEKHRTFDVSEQSLIEFINDVAEKFNAIIIWDTVNKTISFYDNNSPILNEDLDKGLSIEHGKYLVSLEDDPNFDEVVTRLYCYGKDGISITKYNPMGLPYVEDYSYYIYPFERDNGRNVLKHSNYLTDSLCHALLDYADYLKTKDGVFTDLVTQLQTKQETLTTKNNEMDTLKIQLEVLEDNRDLALSTGSSTTDVDNQMSAKNTEIATKQSEIDQVNVDIQNINNQITQLQNGVSMISHFTPEQIIELNYFIKEKSWTDDAYFDEKELYDEGIKRLMRMSQPIVSYSIDIVDFLKAVTCQKDWNRVGIGYLVNIYYPNFNVDIKGRIIEIDHDIDNNKIQLKIANANYIKDGFFSLKDLFKSSVNVSTQVDMNKFKWDKVDENGTLINQVINNKWDANRQAVVGGINENYTLDRRGLTLKDPNDPNNFLRAIHSTLAFTNDGGESYKHAITSQGVVAENVYGKLGAFVEVKANSIVVGDSGETIGDDLITNAGVWNDTASKLSDMSDDAIITPAERISIRDKISIIIGRNIGDTELMPEISELTSGELYYALLNATNNNVLASDPDYQNVVTKYNTLKTHLNSFAPLPWNTTSTSNITGVVENTWVTDWAGYYESIAKLNNRVSQAISDSIAVSFSDLEISYVEAQALNNDLNQLKAESTDIINSATTYGITTEKDAYSQSITDLQTALSPFINQSISFYPISVTSTQRSDISTKLQNVQTKKSALIKLITSKVDAKAIHTGENYSNTFIDNTGIYVKDASNVERVRMGQYETGKYGIKITSGEIIGARVATPVPADGTPGYYAEFGYNWGAGVDGFQKLSSYPSSPIRKNYHLATGGNGGELTIYAGGDGVGQIIGYQIGGTGYTDVYMTVLQRKYNDDSSYTNPNNKGVMLGAGWAEFFVKDSGEQVLCDANFSTDIGRSKNATEVSSIYGILYLHAYESPDARYFDEHISQMTNGECTIQLDPMFLDCIEPDSDLSPWICTATAYDAPMSIYVSEIGNNYVTFKAVDLPPFVTNGRFAWKVSGIRKNFVNNRFMQPSPTGGNMDEAMNSGWENTI